MVLDEGVSWSNLADQSSTLPGEAGNESGSRGDKGEIGVLNQKSPESWVRSGRDISSIEVQEVDQTAQALRSSNNL
jgi:hypothetical protein